MQKAERTMAGVIKVQFQVQLIVGNHRGTTALAVGDKYSLCQCCGENTFVTGEADVPEVAGKQGCDCGWSEIVSTRLVSSVGRGI